MEGAQSLSALKSMDREDWVRVAAHPDIKEAQALIPILRNERRSRSGREGNHDFFVVQSIPVLKERDVFPSDNNVVPHGVNPDHNKSRGQQEKRDYPACAGRQHNDHRNHFPNQILQYQEEAGE